MTARAIVLLLLATSTLFAAANVGAGWLYALGFLFLAYFMTAYATSAWALRNLRVSLRPAARSEAGKALPCSVLLEAVDGRSRRFLSLLAQPLGRRGMHRFFRGKLIPEGWNQVFVAELAAGPGRLETIRFPTPRRGVFNLPPLVIQSPALGIGAVHRAFGGQTEVLVHPRVIPLAQLDWFKPALAREELGRSARWSHGAELIRSVRAYRAGDSLRSVHWRSTAKAGELRIKELEAEHRRGTWSLGLDLGAAHTANSFEHALCVAASLCAYAHAQGFPLQLFSQAGEPAVQSLDSQLDWLARLEWDGASAAPWSHEMEGAGILLTPTHISSEALQIFVGEGEVLGHGLSCPPSCDVASVLGAWHA